MVRALSFLIINGLSWVLIGAVVGYIERCKHNLLFYQIVSSVLGVFAGFALGAISGTGVFPAASVPQSTWLTVTVSCFLCGIFNYTMYVFMGQAMKRGPNAVVWAIIQSGLVYPFIMGWLVFGDVMNIYRGSGIVLIVASVFLYAASGKASGDNSGNCGAGKSKEVSAYSSRMWFIPALLGMLSCGINQCCAVVPSYVEHGQEFPGAYRMIVVSLGMLAGCAVEFYIKYPMRKAKIVFQHGEIRTILVCALAVMAVGNTLSVFLAYPGIDLMEKLGRGSMAYPVMVCSCIIGFFPYGILVLREKFSLVQALGVIAGTAGIILGCLFK